MTVESAPRLSMRRPNALLLKDTSSEFFIAFESMEEKTQWMNTMNQVRRRIGIGGKAGIN